jgi:hypothetical protein
VSESLAEFAFTIKPDGKVVLDEPRRFVKWARRRPSKRMVMAITSEEEWRTNGQNRRLRWLEARFSDATGYTPAESHLFFLKKFSRYTVRLRNGRSAIRLRRTSRMSRRQMAEYTDQVEHFMVEKGVSIPEPKREHAA